MVAEAQGAFDRRSTQHEMAPPFRYENEPKESKN